VRKKARRNAGSDSCTRLGREKGEAGSQQTADGGRHGLRTASSGLERGGDDELGATQLAEARDRCGWGCPCCRPSAAEVNPWPDASALHAVGSAGRLVAPLLAGQDEEGALGKRRADLSPGGRGRLLNPASGVLGQVGLPCSSPRGLPPGLTATAGGAAWVLPAGLGVCQPRHSAFAAAAGGLTPVSLRAPWPLLP
jgi:hypothetical protein